MNKILNTLKINRNNFFKKITHLNIIIILILIISIIIKLGPITLKASHNTLDYNLSINNIILDKYNIQEEYRSPIIPMILYWSDSSNIKYDNDIIEEFTTEDNYNLNLIINKCLKDNKEIDCNKTYNDKQEINYNKKNYNLEITKDSKNNIVYKGKFTNDITTYINKPGIYYILIEGKNKKIKDKIETTIKVSDI